MSSGSGLPPLQHAAFAVTSRLLSSLVTEQILRSLYINIPDLPEISGVLVILSAHLISGGPIIDRALRPNDVFALVPLRCPPVLTGTDGSKHGRPVGLVDPLDMFPEIYECSEAASEGSGQVCSLISSCITLHQPTSFVDQRAESDLGVHDPPFLGAWWIRRPKEGLWSSSTLEEIHRRRCHPRHSSRSHWKGASKFI